MIRLEKTFNIIPASSGVNIFLWVLGLFFAALIVVVFIMPGYDAAAITVTLVVAVGVIVLFASLAYQAKHASFTLTEDGLKIGPGLYGKFIPKEKIDVTGIKVLNLKMDREYLLKWRMNGSGLPGYKSGWFKLKNKEKALVFVTDLSSIVYIPTTDKYAVLLSVRDADLMVEAIKGWNLY
jgi:hypothetical protein